MPAVRWRRLWVPATLAAGLSGMANDASAATLGSLATSVGLLAALALLLAFKGWLAQIGTLWPAGGLLAFSTGVFLLWRAFGSPLPGRASSASGAMARRSSRPGGVVRDASVGRGAALGSLPAGVDPATVTRELCEHFVRVQAAWDANDVMALHALTTAAMLDELRSQRCEFVGAACRTDVVTLEATLLAYERLDSAELVCVEFAGLLRESDGRGEMPFRELWMMERLHAAAAAWKLARQQTLL
jgi:predicted lipid-binding transport protein (Tim44 family)